MHASGESQARYTLESGSRKNTEATEEKTLKNAERVSLSSPHKTGIHKGYGKALLMGTTYTGTSLEERNHASNQGDSYCPLEVLASAFLFKMCVYVFMFLYAQSSVCAGVATGCLP